MYRMSVIGLPLTDYVPVLSGGGGNKFFSRTDCFLELFLAQFSVILEDASPEPTEVNAKY